MDAKLVVLSGPFCGQTIKVHRGKLLIGREEDCDLRPDSEFVSGYHCVLLLDDYTLRIRDLGSMNGTFVNGRRISTASTIILLHDDTVSIGEMNILIDFTPVKPVTEPADTEMQPETPPAALETTTVFEGDTVPIHRPGVTPPPSPAPLPESAPLPDSAAGTHGAAPGMPDADGVRPSGTG
jgi:pSer/pThr/pTyr-binding forkhead associated (FHA) protein